MIKIICNRCNKPIESIDKVGFIQFCYQNPFESVTDSNISDRNHYCENCMTKIERFVKGDAEVNIMLDVNAIVEAVYKDCKENKASKTDDISPVPENITTEPLLREKDFKSEPRSNRRRIDYEKIMSLKESGMRNRDIAAEMGMYPREVSTAICTYKKRQGKAAKTERKESGSKEAECKESQEQEKKIDVGKIGALYKAGWSVPKIMDEMDLTESEVLNVVNKIAEPEIIH